MNRIAIAIASLLGVFIITPALAQVVITQAKAIAGGITPGDTAGYPITLSQPGAYVLESNLNVPLNGYGILANAHNISIDMNGFILAGSGRGYYGLVSAFSEGRIYDGTVSQFQRSAITVRGSGWTFDNMQVVRNAEYGIDATGARLIKVYNSRLTANSISGVIAGDDGYFRDNIVSDSGDTGILCLENCHIEGNNIIKNGVGVTISSGMVIGNTISRNGGYGIVDDRLVDTGLVNNMLVKNQENNSVNTKQIGQGIFVHPNTCVGKPC